MVQVLPFNTVSFFIMSMIVGYASSTVATASNWFQYTYWSDNKCTVYAGEVAAGANSCYPTNFGYGNYTYALDASGTTYTVSVMPYSDPQCTKWLNYETTIKYNKGCTFVPGGGFFYTTAIIDAPTQTFPANGALTTLYDTADDCAANQGEMQYIYEVYGTGICYDFLDGNATTARSCGDYYECSGTTAPAYYVSMNQCAATTSYATATGIQGYPNTVCKTAGQTTTPTVMPYAVPSVAPTGAPTAQVTASIAEATEWFQYKYWTDNKCTQYAGETGAGANVCYPALNGLFGNYSGVMNAAGTVITVTMTPYYDNKCTVPYPGIAVVTQEYNTACTYNQYFNYYYTSGIRTTMPQTFAKNGVLTTLYDTQVDCGNSVGAMTYIFQAYGTGVCFDYLGGQDTSADATCGSLTQCTMTNPDVGPYNTQWNVCPSTTNYVTDTYISGYPLVTCYDTTTSLHPTASPIASIVPSATPTVVPSVAPTAGVAVAADWFQYVYWADSKCTQYAGETGAGAGVCYPSNGIWAIYTYESQGGGATLQTYNIFVTSYADNKCTIPYGTPQQSFYFAGCTLDSSKYNYYTTGPISQMPTEFPADGALTTLYDTVEDCGNNAGAMSYVYEVFGTGICYSYLDGGYTTSSQCGVYSNCYTADTEPYDIAVDTCATTTSLATSTLIEGYARTQCLSAAASNSDGGGSNSAATVTAIAVAVPAAVVLLGVAAYVYYAYFMKSAADGLATPIMSA